MAFRAESWRLMTVIGLPSVVSRWRMASTYGIARNRRRVEFLTNIGLMGGRVMLLRRRPLEG